MSSYPLQTSVACCFRWAGGECSVVYYMGCELISWLLIPAMWTHEYVRRWNILGSHVIDMPPFSYNMNTQIDPLAKQTSSNQCAIIACSCWITVNCTNLAWWQTEDIMLSKQCSRAFQWVYNLLGFLSAQAGLMHALPATFSCKMNTKISREQTTSN